MNLSQSFSQNLDRMLTSLTWRQKSILLGVIRDQRRLAALPWGDGHGMSRDALGRHRLRIQYAKEGLVPMSLESWLGHPPSNSDRVLCCRERQRLEDMGLLERHNPFGRSKRTAYVKLTRDGTEIAKRLMLEEYGVDIDNPVKFDELDIDWSQLLVDMAEEPSESAEPSEPVESAGAMESSEPAKPAESSESAELVWATVPAESTE